MMDHNESRERRKMNKLLTVKEVCELFAVSRGSVIRWIRSGRLAAFKPGWGRFWRVQERDVKKFIKGV